MLHSPHQNLEWKLVWFPSSCLHAFSYSGWFEEAVQNILKKGGGQLEWEAVVIRSDLSGFAN